MCVSLIVYFFDSGRGVHDHVFRKFRKFSGKVNVVVGIIVGKYHIHSFGVLVGL